MKPNRQTGVFFILFGLVIIFAVHFFDTSSPSSEERTSPNSIPTSRISRGDVPPFTEETFVDTSIMYEAPSPKLREGASFIEKEFRVTAYCPCEKCCGGFADGITASGYVIQKGNGFVAAPEKYPFGLMMGIPGYGVVPVEDRGGDIKGNKLDVFFHTHQEALNWGVHYLKVKIYE